MCFGGPWDFVITNICLGFIQYINHPLYNKYVSACGQL